MGTNFYLNENGKSGQHIGKRSAAGLYCWDCRITLCMGGPGNVHHGDSRYREEAPTTGWCPTCRRDTATAWFKACPMCGKKPVDEKLDGGAVGLELGFAKPTTELKTGVRSCSSFSWAMLPYEFHRLHLLGGPKKHDEHTIIDEYGRTMHYQDFLDLVLKNCPIQYLSSIGQEFS